MIVRSTVISLLIVTSLGCRQTTTSAPRDEASFGVTAMRLHPVFTRFKDWTGDGDADGIEAMVEFKDAFGDPTKASGRVLFELYSFKANQPDPRDRRMANPWIGSLQTSEDQRDRWNRASRTYTFPLEIPRADASSEYVLTAQYDSPDGRRLFDRLILEARRESFPIRATTQPAPPQATTKESAGADSSGAADSAARS